MMGRFKSTAVRMYSALVLHAQDFKLDEKGKKGRLFLGKLLIFNDLFVLFYQ